jgi:hypothetical protein
MHSSPTIMLNANGIGTPPKEHASRPWWASDCAWHGERYRLSGEDMRHGVGRAAQAQATAAIGPARPPAARANAAPARRPATPTPAAAPSGREAGPNHAAIDQLQEGCHRIPARG